jgi:dihydrolipoamide dehydrogenase
LAPRLVIIGGGPGGYQAAARAAQLGAEVVLVENAGLGGTCLHHGCIPTKSLLASAAVLMTARRAGEFGLRLEGSITPDMPAIMARKDQVVKVQVQGIEKMLRSSGVRLLWGRGRLATPFVVEASLNGGGSERLEFDRLILATGSRPADLPGVPGLVRDGARVLNSDDALALTEIPVSLAVVGGGVVGCELASIFAALGSQVVVIEARERLLPIDSLDHECSKLLMREMKKAKIATHLGRVAGEAVPEGEGLKLTLAPSPLVPEPPAGELTLSVDKVLVAVGRALNSEGLCLQAMGARLDGRGAVEVDQRLCVADRIWAVGDLLGPRRPMLAHLAGAEGVAAAEMALGRESAVDYAVVPAVAFTFPEVAWVGLTLEQALAAGAEAQTVFCPVRLLGKSQAMGEIAGQIRMVSEKGSGRLLGAHLIGPHAADLVHECTLALRLGATVADIAHTIHAHPTLSEGLKEAAEAALGRAIHLPQSNKSRAHAAGLTPRSGRVG